MACFRVPITPPSSLVMTMVDERGGANPLGQVLLRVLGGSGGSVPPLPGCCMLMNSDSRSAVLVQPVISRPFDPVRKRPLRPVGRFASIVWQLSMLAWMPLVEGPQSVSIHSQP